MPNKNIGYKKKKKKKKLTTFLRTLVYTNELSNVFKMFFKVKPLFFFFFFLSAS